MATELELKLITALNQIDAILDAEPNTLWEETAVSAVFMSSSTTA